MRAGRERPTSRTAVPGWGLNHRTYDALDRLTTATRPGRATPS